MFGGRENNFVMNFFVFVVDTQQESHFSHLTNENCDNANGHSMLGFARQLFKLGKKKPNGEKFYCSLDANPAAKDCECERKKRNGL
jgi:hypothetical protein